MINIPTAHDFTPLCTRNNIRDIFCLPHLSTERLDSFLSL
jgi:hypothetical protein